jgi:DNA polymerase alpha-associated DNA helicase A
MEKTLEALKRHVSSSLSPLVSILLGLSPPPSYETPKESIGFLDVNLNESQKDAVSFATAPSTVVGLIHGPPGTGKTQTLVEVIRQFVKDVSGTLRRQSPDCVSEICRLVRRTRLSSSVERAI